MSALEDLIYTSVEEKILAGDFAPGEPLTEARLSEVTGASRTPVREALHRLERDGLVSMRQNRTAVVVGITRADLADIYEIRRRVEGLASRRAAETATAEDIATAVGETTEAEEDSATEGVTEEEIPSDDVQAEDETSTKDSEEQE